MKLTASVVYVSDNKFMHIIIKDTLKPYNVTVYDAYNGEEALKYLIDHKADLVLSDIDMPGIDGYELCSKIHQMDHLKSVPVVIYSSSESNEDIEKAFASGAKGYIVKKYQKAELAEKIIHYIR